MLPLANLTGDERQEYFADGMHEVLVTELSQIPELTVISRQSTVQYQGTDRPVPVIARELGVDALLEGSVFRAEDSVRITVQLIRADPEGHMWAGTYHGALRNAIALQGEVARAVGLAIHARAAPESHARLAAAVRPEAQEAYLQGLYHLERQMIAIELTRSDRLEVLRTAVASLENAVALAPEWAAAHAKLARAYHWIASNYEELAAEFYAKSKAAALRALELDPNEAQAHASLGFVLFNHEWDWEGAERSIQRALALDPNSHQWIYALFLMAVGRYDEATTHFRRAQERNPLSMLLKRQLAWAYSCAGRHDEAIAELEELQTRLGDSPDWLRAAFGQEYLMRSMYPEAIAALESAVTVSDSNPWFVPLLAQATPELVAWAMHTDWCLGSSSDWGTGTLLISLISTLRWVIPGEPSRWPSLLSSSARAVSCTFAAQRPIQPCGTSRRFARSCAGSASPNDPAASRVPYGSSPRARPGVQPKESINPSQESRAWADRPNSAPRCSSGACVQKPGSPWGLRANSRTRRKT